LPSPMGGGAAMNRNLGSAIPDSSLPRGGPGVGGPEGQTTLHMPLTVIDDLDESTRELYNQYLPSQVRAPIAEEEDFSLGDTPQGHTNLISTGEFNNVQSFVGEEEDESTTPTVLSPNLPHPSEDLQPSLTPGQGGAMQRRREQSLGQQTKRKAPATLAAPRLQQGYKIPRLNQKSIQVQMLESARDDLRKKMEITQTNLEAQLNKETARHSLQDARFPVHPTTNTTLDEEEEEDEDEWEEGDALIPPATTGNRRADPEGFTLPEHLLPFIIKLKQFTAPDEEEETSSTTDLEAQSLWQTIAFRTAGLPPDFVAQARRECIDRGFPALPTNTKTRTEYRRADIQTLAKQVIGISRSISSHMVEAGEWQPHKEDPLTSTTFLPATELNTVEQYMGMAVPQDMAEHVLALYKEPPTTIKDKTQKENRKIKSALKVSYIWRSHFQSLCQVPKEPTLEELSILNTDATRFKASLKKLGLRDSSDRATRQLEAALAILRTQLHATAWHQFDATASKSSYLHLARLFDNISEDLSPQDLADIDEAMRNQEGMIQSSFAQHAIAFATIDYAAREVVTATVILRQDALKALLPVQQYTADLHERLAKLPVNNKGLFGGKLENQLVKTGHRKAIFQSVTAAFQPQYRGRGRRNTSFGDGSSTQQPFRGGRTGHRAGRSRGRRGGRDTGRGQAQSNPSHTPQAGGRGARGRGYRSRRGGRPNRGQTQT